MILIIVEIQFKKIYFFNILKYESQNQLKNFFFPINFVLKFFLMKIKENLEFYFEKIK